MIDYKKLKQIFPNGLPESHIFFAHREVSDVMKISYATLRRETGYRSTNRGAWVRFEKKFAEETADVPVDSIALTLPSSVEVGKKIAGLINILPADATIEDVELAISDVTKATGNILQTPTTGTPNGALEVTGKAVGSVTVKILCKGKESNVITVAVKAAVVPVASVTVAPKTATIDFTKTTQLTPTVLPAGASNKAVTYTSSDTTVATVNASGLVTALSKAGSTTITVKTTDGNKTDTAVITVKAPVIAVTDITIAPKPASVVVGSTVKLTGTVVPANATNKSVTYSSSDSTVATVSSDGTVTGVKAGTATITATSADGSKAATSVVTVTAA